MSASFEDLSSTRSQISLLRSHAGRLEPYLHARWRELIYNRSELIHDAVGDYGSPLHIIGHRMLQRNMQQMTAAAERHHVDFVPLYALKANGSPAFVRSAAEEGLGADVSSEHEYDSAVSNGIDPHRISASGPVKSRSWIRRLITEASLISIDSLEALSDLVEATLQNRLDRKARVLVRVRPSGSDKRFGIDVSGLAHLITFFVEHAETILFEGFHFHLSGYQVESRIELFRDLAPVIDIFHKAGLPSSIVNMGGGIPIQYISTEDQARFESGISMDQFYNRTLPRGYYPYGGGVPKSEWVDRLFMGNVGGGVSIADFCRSRQMSVMVEPGRAALDQAAVSVFRVAVMKRQIDRDIVFLDGSSFSACETWFNSEYLVDPILLSRPGKSQLAGSHRRIHLAGHSCLEDDMIAQRAFASDVPVRPGDLLVFANTAGYQMDMLENHFHLHPSPQKVYVDLEGALEIQGAAI